MCNNRKHLHQGGNSSSRMTDWLKWPLNGVFFIVTDEQITPIGIIFSKKLFHSGSLRCESELTITCRKLCLISDTPFQKAQGSSSDLHCVPNPWLGGGKKKKKDTNFSILVKHCPGISGKFTNCLIFYFYSFYLTLTFTFVHQTPVQEGFYGLTWLNFCAQKNKTQFTFHFKTDTIKARQTQSEQEPDLIFELFHTYLYRNRDWC